MGELDIKKAENQRIDAFELWCWRRLLRIPWISWRSNQSIIKQISPEYSLEGLMLKLKLQYFGHLMQRTDSFERHWFWERLKAGEGDNRGWDGWMASTTQWAWVWINSGSWRWRGRPGLACCSPWGCKELDTPERLNWTKCGKNKWISTNSPLRRKICSQSHPHICSLWNWFLK